MADNIDRLMAKYKLSRAEAMSFFNSILDLEKGGLSPENMERLLPTAIQFKRTKTYVAKDNTVKPISWGMAFSLANKGADINTMIGRRRNLPSDRKDTQFIPNKMPGGTRITDLKSKEIHLGETKFTPTYHHLKSDQGNEIVNYKDPETKYYYYDEDDMYNHQGNDTQPSDPFTPYIAVKLLHKVGASKYSKPTSTIIGDKTIVDWRKEPGIKEYGMFYMMGGDIIRAKLVTVPYERDVEFNMYKMKLFKNHILIELNKFMKEHNDLLRQLRKSKSKIELTPEDEKKLESARLYKEYYGELEERRRKRNKAKPKRKRVVRKPVIVKRRCKCNPKQKRVIKKITRRRKIR